jgi:aryl-alcohol dehydrogenase-like predicted oxidoreductase
VPSKFLTESQAYDFCMTRSPFGTTGFDVSPLGFGAAPIGYLQTDRDRVGKILNFLLDHGVNLIDTAASYPGSEEVIAETVGSRRDQFVLVSKCGTKLPDLDGEPFSADLVSKTVDRSLQRLRVEHIDVMLLHSCDLKTLQQGDALGALVKAREQGKIKFAGYSGDNEAAAYAAALPDVAVIETSISIADQHNIDAVLPVAQKQDVGVLAKRPVANAAWKDIAQQQGLYKNYAKTYTDRLAQMNLDPASLGLGGPADEAWPELALRFTLSQPGVHCAIIGTTNPDNARRNIAFAEKGPLPQETVARIRQAFRSADPEGKWTGQT